MPASLIEGLIGGIGLFLCGMRFLSSGVRGLSDARIRDVSRLLTTNRAVSACSGAILSLVLGSGSAALIAVLALVNGGILTPFHAFNVLAGVLLGSSFLLHLPFVPYSLIASPLILVGISLKLFAHRRQLSSAGELIMGAGLLFFGINLLEQGFRLADSHPLSMIADRYLMQGGGSALLFGTLVSFLVQSARSSIAIIHSLLAAAPMALSSAGAMVLGGCAGMALIGLLASVGGTMAARRVALTLFFLACAVSLVMLPGIEQMLAIARLMPHGYFRAADFASLAWLSTAASAGMAVMLLALSGLLGRRFKPSEHGTNSSGTLPSQPCAGYLDQRILTTPALAVEQARKETIRMMTVAVYMYADVREILHDYDARRADTISQHEQVLDSLNHEITGFLASLSNAAASPAVSFVIPGLFQTVSDIEHIGDRCEDILSITIERKEKGIVFSDEAMADVKLLTEAVASSVSLAESILCQETEIFPAEQLYREKRRVREVIARIRQEHFERIGSGVCLPGAALLFNDMVTAFAGIADLCWNIAGTGRRSRQR